MCARLRHERAANHALHRGARPELPVHFGMMTLLLPRCSAHGNVLAPGGEVKIGDYFGLVNRKALLIERFRYATLCAMFCNRQIGMPRMVIIYKALIYYGID